MGKIASSPKTADGELPEACPICREQHESSRALNYDGIGVNSCGMYRSRIATLPEEYRALGPVMAAAPKLLEALERLTAFPGLLGKVNDGGDHGAETVRMVRAAIAAARGRL